jgi:hypothetical protein
MRSLGRAPAVPGRGFVSLGTDTSGALALFASDIQAVESAIGRRFSAEPVTAGLDRALGARSASAARAAWTEFYRALQRFVYVASVVVSAPAPPDLAAAFRRFEQILDDDFAHALFAPTERRRLKRRISGLASLPAIVPASEAR